MSAKPQISLAEIAKKVEEGWKKPALAEHYGLPVSQMTKILKDANIRIRKFHEPKYTIIDDREIVNEDQLEPTQEDISDVHGAILESPETSVQDIQDEVVAEISPVEQESNSWMQ